MVLIVDVVVGGGGLVVVLKRKHVGQNKSERRGVFQTNVFFLSTLWGKRRDGSVLQLLRSLGFVRSRHASRHWLELARTFWWTLSVFWTKIQKAMTQRGRKSNDIKQ
jgi:hypothetical protein